MFKIEKEEYMTKNIRIPVRLVERMSIIAQKNDISLNKLIVKCCEYAIENMEDDK